MNIFNSRGCEKLQNLDWSMQIIFMNRSIFLDWDNQTKLMAASSYSFLGFS